MRPPRCSRGAAATRAASSGRSTGCAPPRGAVESCAPVVWAGSRSTCSRMRSGAPSNRSRRTVAASIASMRAIRSTDSMTSAWSTTAFTLLRCRRPMKCQRAGAVTSGRLSRSSCALFSPMSVTPLASTRRTSAAGKFFVTAVRATSPGSRPARWHARAICARTSATLAAISAARASVRSVSLIARSRSVRRADPSGRRAGSCRGRCLRRCSGHRRRSGVRRPRATDR